MASIVRRREGCARRIPVSDMQDSSPPPALVAGTVALRAARAHKC
ncbi:hypothetical protein A2U01_0041776 [Trifolium medium]|uniref:Uncharacterized protein n=1 Tax=Trifolium medium TaxID=97028 RepID=A0A392Q903_9FABA|nr:hypothetical protein [Trifolium medium]